MSKSLEVIAGVGLSGRARKSRWPARLDLRKASPGLVLALFMWGHMFFVSSILLGKDAMWTVTKFFEGYFFFGRSYPWFVSVVVAGDHRAARRACAPGACASSRSTTASTDRSAATCG